MNIKLSTLFISIIGAIVFITTTNATTMCVTSDNNSIILDPSIEGTNSTGISENMTWTATFSYGTVSGIAACNSTNGSYARAYPEYNFDNNHTSSEGVHCWCRMTSPVRSAWVYDGDVSSASFCASGCANRCGRYVQGYSDFRGGVFTSAGM